MSAFTRVEMLPVFLFDSYKRYKQDAEEFLKWFAETAIHCGYMPISFHAPAEMSRLKVKARTKGTTECWSTCDEAHDFHRGDCAPRKQHSRLQKVSRSAC